MTIKLHQAMPVTMQPEDKGRQHHESYSALCGGV